MKQTTRVLLTVAVALILIASFSILSYGQTAQTMLTRHVPQIVSSGKAQLLGHLPPSQIMRFDIVVPLRDQPGLDIFTQQLYDPSSIFFHQFITPEEFTARFGPSEQDWDATVNFAKANGFEITSGTRDERDLRVTGTVASIEQAFHVNLNVYQHPTENRTFFSPDREPSANLSFPLWHVSGLDNYITKRSMLVNKYDYAKAHNIDPDAIPLATTGSGPSASFLGSDMRHAYYCNGACGGSALTGAGQNLALFEYEGTALSDLTLYFTNVGQTNSVPITLISTDGTSTGCTGSCDDGEQTLDMTQAIGMAPGLAALYFYVGNTDTAILSAMVATAKAPLSSQISCSWGWTADVSTLNPYFQQMGTQNQNFFAASGDSGYWHGTGSAAPWPADDAYVVGVGGTDLTTSSAAGPWASETTWVDSGGGITTNSIPIPSWQQISGVITSGNAGSTTLRNGPDVSANANFTFYICDRGSCSANQEGGTSFAAPMWAGYLALANQQAAANSEVIGFINPTIYPQAVLGGTTYSNLFHDITSGSSNGKYSATSGFDLVTGWGSPNGSGLINLLAPSGLTSQTITCGTTPPASEVYNGNFTIACTASSGLAVTYSSSGGCSNSGATYTMTSGTTACTVDVNQSGNSTYSAAPQVAYSVTATKASQTISFTTNAPASATYGSNFTVAASATSGLAVAYTSSGSCSNSSATYTMTSGAGTCSVIANQAGNTDYSAASQVTQSTTAAPASQSISFTTNAPSSAAYNANFTVVATATSGLAVSYTSSGSCSNSGATYTMTSGTGTCSVIANQAGNTNYTAATQVTENVTATAASQTITFSTNAPASKVYQGSFTVAATASSGLAVAFTSAGSCSNSGATYTMTSGTGTCSVIANQAGNSNYSAAPTVTQTTNATPASQAITFTTNAPSTAGYGSSFTVAATGGASGNPVVFTSAGSCSNSGATYTMTSGTGTCSVIANQAGNSNYSAAPQVTQSAIAALATSTTTVASSENPSNSGDSVTFTATINGQFGMVKGRKGGNNARSMAVTGTVTWSSNTGCGATLVTTGNSGTATCTTSALPVGTDAVTANYSGDSNHSSSMGTLSGGQVVNQPTLTATSTAVGSSLDPTIYGQAVSFTATVTSGSGTPTGTVQFSVDGNPFGSPVTLVSGTANSASTTTLAVGTHTVSAAYSGAATYSPSTGALSGGQVVNTASAGLSLASSGNPSNLGQSVTFTATINGQYGLIRGRNSRNGAKPMDVTGTVTWSSNTGCGTTNVTSGPTGTATCTTSALPIGTDTVTATYNGDGNHVGGGSGSFSQTVNQTAATTAVGSTLNPSVYGQSVSFTATVTGSSPTGTVQFFVDGNPFDTENLVSGSATSISTSALSQGTHTVTATYSGDTNNAGGSGSLTGGQVVNPASAAISVATSGTPTVYGQSVTFTATISGQYGQARRNLRGKPETVTGGVTWSANTGCGTTAVTAGNPGTATCTTSSLSVGNDLITATYNGDSNHSSGTGTLSGGQTVTQATQTITFTTNAPSSAAYNSNFTVAATASSGLPVAFTSAGSCSNSGASYTMTSGTGTCFVIANQGGNAGYAAAPQVTQDVSATLASQTINVSVAAPSSATYKSTFTIVATASSGLPITFASSGSCTNSGATYTITKSTGTCNATLTQPGNSNYSAAAPVTSQTPVVKAGPPTVSFTGAPTSAPYQSTFTVIASSTNDTSIPTITPTGVCSVSDTTVNGTTVTATVTMTSGTGACTLKAAWAASGPYLAATVSQKTTAKKLTPTLTFSGAPTSAGNGTNFTVTASSNETGTLVSVPTITTTTGTVCTVGAVTTDGMGNYQATVTMIKATGTCTTKAALAANAGYLAASALQHTTAHP